MAIVRRARLLALVLLAAPAAGAQPRTADPIKRGLQLSDFPRVVKLAENVYGYEEIRQPGFTTVSLVVVGRNGVLIADAQGSVAATQAMLDKIKAITPLPVKWYVVGSDHGDHTGGNSVLPKDLTFVVHPASRAQLLKDSAAAAAPGRGGAPRPAVIVPPVARASAAATARASLRSPRLDSWARIAARSSSSSCSSIVRPTRSAGCLKPPGRVQSGADSPTAKTERRPEALRLIRSIW